MTTHAPHTPATVEIRPVTAIDGVVVSVVGDVDAPGAATLSCRLHGVLDGAPAVVVVDLGAVGALDPAVLEVLAVARERARDDGVSVHLVDRGRLAVRHRLTVAGLV